ncbi:MAG: hypothetical protein EXS08_16460 [Planctomycetes bacterium]|nr:hypothetical protein [Planctomycetota bacterium]
MKRITSLLVSLSLLASAAMAQAVPPPTITGFPQTRRAYSTANLGITGTNLGVVTAVKVNGVSIPIVRTTATRLVVGPVPQQDAGFGTLEAIHGRGTIVNTLPLLPTLKGERRYTHMNVTLNNGEAGTYVLRSSYTVLGSPAADQSIYGKRYLGLFSSTLAAGVFGNADPVALNGILFPSQIGLIGAPLFLQAECFAATSNVSAYTNAISIPGYGQHQ